MSAIFESAAKIVFIMVALTACIAFILGILEAKDFMLLASMAFAFYFAAPSTPSTDAAGIASK